MNTTNIFTEKLKDICCGCRACEQICPKECISIRRGEEGFLLPFYTKNKCNSCKRCVTVCPSIKIAEKHIPKQAYGLVHKSVDVTKKSSSGGAFMLFAQHVIENGGSVFACIYDENFNVITTEATGKELLKAFQGSKYVQCDTKKVYSHIKNKLIDGKSILYCSTPCQIAGLKNYLGKEYSSLLLIDLFCEGVASPELFEKYLFYLTEKRNNKISSFTFRDGTAPWGVTGYYTVKGKKYVITGDKDPYYFAFLHQKTYNKKCYFCSYACAERVGDISIGDFWGVDQEYSHVDTSRGVSAVLINTDKGENIFEAVKNNSIYFNTTIDKISAHNYVLIHPTKINPERDVIYANFKKISFGKFVKKYLKPDGKVLIKVKSFVLSALKAFHLTWIIDIHKRRKKG